MDSEYMWYVGYGSNLCRDRFRRYIEGGKYRWGGSDCKKCPDQPFLDEYKQIKIPHRLFFAYEARRWESGGVAFIDPERKLDEDKFTYGRMWKITRKQFPHIRKEEGIGLYDIELPIGQDDGIPIVTITTSNVKLKPKTPSDNYLRTVVNGLKDTFQLSDESILKYLIEKPGIEGNLTKGELLKIIGLDY